MDEDNVKAKKGETHQKANVVKNLTTVVKGRGRVLTMDNLFNQVEHSQYLHGKDTYAFKHNQSQLGRTPNNVDQQQSIQKTSLKDAKVAEFTTVESLQPFVGWI